MRSQDDHLRRRLGLALCELLTFQSSSNLRQAPARAQHQSHLLNSDCCIVAVKATVIFQSFVFSRAFWVDGKGFTYAFVWRRTGTEYMEDSSNCSGGSRTST